MRLDKPIGTLLLLWPTLWALWIAARGRPHWAIVWIFALGTLLMRSAGCVINDYRRPRFRPARRAHPGPSARRRRGEPRARRSGSPRCSRCSRSRWCCSSTGSPSRCRSSRSFLAASYPFTKRFFAHAAGLPRHRLRLRHPDGVRGAAGDVPAAALGLLAGQRLLGDRLRHRVRDGRPRRRRQDRHQDLGDHVRPLRRRGGDAVLRGDARGARRGSACTSDSALALLRRARGAPPVADGLPLHADPRPRRARAASRRSCTTTGSAAAIFAGIAAGTTRSARRLAASGISQRERGGAQAWISD